MKHVKTELSSPKIDVLSQCRVYLAGPIEFSSNDGTLWRREFCSLIYSRNINLKIVDPTDKGSNVQGEIGEEREKLRRLKEDGDFDGVRKIMKEVRRWDLRAVDYSHFIVVNLPPGIPTYGTTDECVVAERQCKPIFAIIDGGPKNAPDWMFAMMRHEEMFDSVEACVDHITDINNGNIPLDHRWVMI